MKVYIMRGPPGAGKSKWIEENRPGSPGRSGDSWVVCSADHFHMVGGEYRYDPKNAGEAHDACLRKFADIVVNNHVDHDVLVVDNTNTTAIELAPYVRLCEAFGVEYEIVFIRCTPGLAFSRNVHAVPEATIWNMFQNLLSERLPARWKIKFLEA